MLVGIYGTVPRSLYFPEVIFNQPSLLSGDKWRTPEMQMECDGVEIEITIRSIPWLPSFLFNRIGWIPFFCKLFVQIAHIMQMTLFSPIYPVL
jgi:hypothetical protein